MSEQDRVEKVLDRAYGSRVRIGDRPAQDPLNPLIGDKSVQDALIKLLKDLAAGRAAAPSMSPPGSSVSFLSSASPAPTPAAPSARVLFPSTSSSAGSVKGDRALSAALAAEAVKRRGTLRSAAARGPRRTPSAL